MNTFRVEEEGYCRHKNDFSLWILFDREDVCVSEAKIGSCEVCAHSIIDDFGNGIAEFLFPKIEKNNWSCDYVKTDWNWNNSSSTTFITQKGWSLPVHDSTYGIQQEGDVKRLCRVILESVLREALKEMRLNQNLTDYAKKLYCRFERLKEQ